MPRQRTRPARLDLTRDDLRHPMSLRLTSAQDHDMREVAAARGVSVSEGLRTLIDLGRMLHAGHVAGVAVTPELLRLLNDDADAFLSVRAGLTKQMCQAIGLGDSRAALAGGTVLMTGEQGDLCDELAP